MNRCVPILLAFAAIAAAQNLVRPFRDSNLDTIVRKYIPNMKPGEPLSETQIAAAILVSAQGAGQEPFVPRALQELTVSLSPGLPNRRSHPSRRTDESRSAAPRFKT